MKKTLIRIVTSSSSMVLRGDEVRDGKRCTIIPWQSGSHWRCVVLVNIKGKGRVWIFDPLGAGRVPKDMSNFMKKLFRQHWPTWLVTTISVRRLQQDGYNCGIWIIYFATMFVEWLQVASPYSCFDTYFTQHCVKRDECHEGNAAETLRDVYGKSLFQAMKLPEVERYRLGLFPPGSG